MPVADEPTPYQCLKSNPNVPRAAELCVVIFYGNHKKPSITYVDGSCFFWMRCNSFLFPIPLCPPLSRLRRAIRLLYGI